MSEKALLANKKLPWRSARDAETRGYRFPPTVDILRKDSERPRRAAQRPSRPCRNGAQYAGTTNERNVFPVVPYTVDGKVIVRTIDPAHPSSTIPEAERATSRNGPGAQPGNGQPTSPLQSIPVSLELSPSVAIARQLPDRPPQAEAKKSLYKVLGSHDYGRRTSVPPRGLLNQHNMCFFNSVLQALVHSQALYALLMAIKNQTLLKISSETPVLDGLVAFAGQYAIQPMGNTRPMNAENLYSVICEHPKFEHVVRGRQEDAQEFMGYLFDTLEENFAAALASNEAPATGVPGSESALDADDWTEVGRNSKPIVARQSGLVDEGNPILKIFGGRLRSVLKKAGASPSITLDPFQQVPLDISHASVNTVQDALNHMCEEEKLQLSCNGKFVEATKRVEFDRTPRILVVYLKRFTFINKGGKFEFGKITKPIEVGSIRVASAGGVVSYRPFAIVYHHGSSATAGHYTAEVRVDDVWYNIDDDYVSVEAARSTENCAYMVFYETVDRGP